MTRSTPRVLGNAATLRDVIVQWREMVRALNEIEEKAERFGTLSYERVATATHTVSTLIDVVLVDYTTTGACTVTLPAAASMRERMVWIKDSGGMAMLRNITIDGSGSETIDGGATLTLITNYATAALYCDGAAWHRLGS